MNKNKNNKTKYSYGYAIELYKPFKEKEEQFNIKLKNDKYYIVRFDGKSMTSDYKIKHCAINKKFFNIMEKVFIEFCKRTEGIVFGYSFSDEISILINANKLKKEDKRAEKILSLWASTISSLFYKVSIDNTLNLKRLPVFDARIIEIKKEDIVPYFIARQAFAIDKYLMQLKSKHGLSKANHTSKSVIKELETKGIIYDDLPLGYRYGLLFSKEAQQPFEFSKNLDLINKLIFD